MPKVTYTPAKGLLQEAGSGITLTVLPSAVVQVQNASSGSLPYPGVYTVSGTNVVTSVLPNAASFPGGLFVIRSLSAKAHAVTGSQAGNIFTDGTSVGKNIALNPLVGSSVSLLSDGLSYHLLANSGSLTIT